MEYQLRRQKVAELKPQNGTTFKEISCPLQRNSAALSTEGVNQMEIQKLLASENTYVYQHYPFEWMLAYVPAVVVLFVLLQRLQHIQRQLVALGDRITAHTKPLLRLEQRNQPKAIKNSFSLSFTFLLISVPHGNVIFAPCNSISNWR